MPNLGAIAVIAVAVVVAALLAILIFFWWKNSGAAPLAVKEQTVAGQAVVNAAQATAAQQAQQIVVSGGARDSVDITLHQANAQAIQAAPGANAAVSPALNAAGRHGLCEHPAYQGDPDCAAVTP